jgi:hypothetical protein
MVLAATSILVLAISACGGDNSPEQPIVIPTETTSALSKADFIQEADAVCAEANAAIVTFAENGQGVTAAAEIADLRQGVVDDLNSLGPPDEDRRTLDEFTTALEGQVEAGKKIALANERQSDTTEFETELQSAKADAATAASSYGFEECGTDAAAGATGTTDATGGTVTPSAPVTPAPVAPDTSGGGVGDTGGDTGSSGGGVSPGGGISP